MNEELLAYFNVHVRGSELQDAVIEVMRFRGFPEYKEAMIDTITPEGFRYAIQYPGYWYSYDFYWKSWTAEDYHFFCEVIGFPHKPHETIRNNHSRV